MRFFSGFSAAALLLLWCSVSPAGPIGPVEVLSTGVPEYRVDFGGGYFRQGRRVRTTVGQFDLTRNEVYGTLRYTGYDWSVAGRFGGATLNEKQVEAMPGDKDHSEGFKPMIGFVAKALVFSDTSGDFAVGATVQANRYLFDHYQGYYNVGIAFTAQQRWGGMATLYGGPFFTFGSARRKGTVIDNNGLVVVDTAKETSLVGLCAGFSFTLPKSMVFEVEGQYTGLTDGNGFSGGLSEWGVGAGLRFPLWY